MSDSSDEDTYAEQRRLEKEAKRKKKMKKKSKKSTTATRKRYLYEEFQVSLDVPRELL